MRGGINLYAYVQGDPVNWVDPWGLKSLGDFKYYKRWGGPGWTAGQWTSWDKFSAAEKKKILDDIANNPASDYAPLDSQDQCYMNHDICYGDCRDRCKNDPCPDECIRKGLNKCDRGLRNCLIKIGLSGNPLNEARRIAAIPVFELQAANRDAREENLRTGSSWWFKWSF